MRPLDELLLAWRDGSITADELKHLETLLADPAARERLYDEFMLTASIVDVLKTGAPATPRQEPRKVSNPARLRIFFGAAAAVGLIFGALLIWTLTRRSPEFQIVNGTALVDSTLNGPIHENSIVACQGPAPATVAFPDGSTMELAPAAEAVVHARSAELRSGSATFEVRKSAGKEFAVQTPAGSLAAQEAKFSVELRQKQNTQNGGLEMKAHAWVLSVAVLAGGVSVNFNGADHYLALGQSVAFGADADQPALPQELKGFSGVVSGTVVSADKGSFVLKIKVASKKNESKPFEKAALAGKDVVVVTKDVKDLPELAANDVVYVTVTESNGQLVAEKLFKVKPKTPAKTGNF